MTWNVMHVFRNDAGLTFIEVDLFDNETAARAHANHLPNKGGEVWIEERSGKSRPAYHDRPSKPLSRERIAELKSQIGSLQRRSSLKEGEGA